MHIGLSNRIENLSVYIYLSSPDETASFYLIYIMWALIYRIYYKKGFRQYSARSRYT